MRGNSRVECAQATVKPARIILSNLRIAPFGALQPRVAKHERLRKGECGLTEMKRIEISSEVRLMRFDGKRCRAVLGDKVLTDRRGLRHEQIAVKKCRDRAQRIDLEIGTVMNARGEWQELELVDKSEFFQRPKRPERTPS